jgi:hypothetical protein
MQRTGSRQTSMNCSTFLSIELIPIYRIEECDTSSVTMILGLKHQTRSLMLVLFSTACDATSDTAMVHKAIKEALRKIDYNLEKGIKFKLLLVREQRIHASGKPSIRKKRRTRRVKWLSN